MKLKKLNYIQQLPQFVTFLGFIAYSVTLFLSSCCGAFFQVRLKSQGELMKRRIILLSLLSFTSLANAEKGIYAEEIIHDIEQGLATYTYLNESSNPYLDSNLQQTAKCSLSKGDIIQAISVEPELPTDFFIWKNHAFYIRNSILDEYFKKGELIQAVSESTSDLHLEVIFTDLYESEFKKFLEFEIALRNKYLTDEKTHSDELDKSLVGNKNATTEIREYAKMLKDDIHKVEQTLKHLNDLLAQFTFLSPISTSDLDNYFEKFPEKRSSAISFINLLFEESKTMRIPSYPYHFRVLKIGGRLKSGMCEAKNDFWQIAYSSKIGEFGPYSSLEKMTLIEN
jgi:hypothetical protein